MKHVVVFARAPRAGVAAPLFSPALPGPLADALHAALLADTLGAAAACGAQRRTIAWASRDDAGDAPAGFESALQSGGDLGERLAAAFDHEFGAGAGHALVIAPDAPAITAPLLDRAFDALASHAVVLGPASGGGFWLVGLSRPAPAFVSGVAWEAPGAGAAAPDLARALGLEAVTLPALADLGGAADLARLVGDCAAAAPGERPCGPAVRAALTAMGFLR